jgi:hypothetical protein
VGPSPVGRDVKVEIRGTVNKDGKNRCTRTEAERPFLPASAFEIPEHREIEQKQQPHHHGDKKDTSFTCFNNQKLSKV